MEEQPYQSKCESRIKHLENKKRFIQNAIEMALSMGDYQKEINQNFSSGQIYEETGKRIDCLINFETQAFYMVDQNNSDLVLSYCKPDELRWRLESEVEYLINKGLIAWALGERRGVAIPSKDIDRKIFLHVIATYSRIRGVFIGMLPACRQSIPDAAFGILSIILRNMANALESVEYQNLRDNQKSILEEQLHQKTKELIQSERKIQNIKKIEAIATLAGGIAHEFNNALSGVMLNIDILRLAFPENKQIIKHVDGVKRSAKYMAELTKQLLAYAQGGRYRVKNILFNEFMRGALPAVKHVVSPFVQVDMQIPAGLYAISADLTQLQMVLAAVLANASEAIEDTGRILIYAKNIEINEPCTENECEITPGHYICLTIEDDGAGMDENTCSHIFDPFFTTRFQGRGLGMAAVYGIIKNHGGWVSVDSAAGKGTKVRIFLPETEIAKEEKNRNSALMKNLAVTKMSQKESIGKNC
jgi:signal transduction histidine kinase